MKLLLNIVTIFIISLAFSWPVTAVAWNRQDQYKADDKQKRHYKKHYRNSHPGNTPNWEDYHHRLRHRFNFNRHSDKKYSYRHSNRKQHYGHSYRPYSHDSRDRYYTSAQGWDLIKKDRFHEALDLFGEVASIYPNRGEPKIGYAIVAAQSRQMFNGVRAMRRALLYEPEALNRVQVDSRLYSRLKRLVSEYQSSFHGLSRSDTHFMVASLYFMMGRQDHCRRELEKNDAENDRAPSTINLYRLAGYQKQG